MGKRISPETLYCANDLRLIPLDCANFYPYGEETKTGKVKVGKVLLNLGCGRILQSGWLNCDINKEYHPDKCFDMNKFPYPFKSNYADEILLSHVLEHLDNPMKVIDELWRISKKGAIVTVAVPHFSHFTAYGDFTHKHFFSSYIFKSYGYESKFKVEKIRFTCFRRHPIKVIDFFLNLNPTFTELIFCKLIPVSEIKFILKPIK